MHIYFNVITFYKVAESTKVAFFMLLAWGWTYYKEWEDESKNGESQPAWETGKHKCSRAVRLDEDLIGE